MNNLDHLPKTIKKTLRYIKQDVDTLEKLDHLEKLIILSILHRKRLLNKRIK